MKPECYTTKIYSYFQGILSPNLAFITDDGKNLEADEFFDLCIANIRDNNQWYLPELDIWFQRQKEKVGKKGLTYGEKKKVLRNFFEQYQTFFAAPTIQLSGGIEEMVRSILNKGNPL